MVDGFQARAKRVNSLLADPHTCFLVVCGPQGEPIDEAVYFHRKLVEAKLPFGGVIVNKVHYPAEQLRGDGDDLAAALAGEARRRGPGAARRRELRRLPGAGRARRRATSSTSPRELRTQGVIRVPYLDEDVHDLAGLAEINRYLFATQRGAHRDRRRPRLKAGPMGRYVKYLTYRPMAGSSPRGGSGRT